MVYRLKSCQYNLLKWNSVYHLKTVFVSFATSHNNCVTGEKIIKWYLHFEVVTSEITFLVSAMRSRRHFTYLVVGEGWTKRCSGIKSVAIVFVHAVILLTIVKKSSVSNTNIVQTIEDST